MSPTKNKKTLSSIKKDSMGYKTPNIGMSPIETKSNRDVQYSESKECENIKPTHTKEEILKIGIKKF